MNSKVILVMGIIAGLLVGYAIGMSMGIDLTIKKVISIMPLFTNITINEQAMNDALFQYDNRINSCYGGKDALIRNN